MNPLRHWSVLALLSLSTQLPAAARATCLPVAGDVDGSGTTNVADVTCAISTGIWTQLGGGSAPACLAYGTDGADVDCSGDITFVDVQALIVLAFEKPLPAFLDGDGDLCVDACPSGGDPVTVPVDFTIDDFDVSNDGAATVAGRSGNQILAACFDGNGQATKATFLVGTLSPSASFGWNGIYVARADVSGHSVLAVHLEDGPVIYPSYGGQASTFRLFFLDPQCNVLSTTHDVPALSAGVAFGHSEYYDIVTSDTGRVATVFSTMDGPEQYSSLRYQLAVFGPDGAALVPPTEWGTGECHNPTYGIRVAMRETSGDFIVSCQGHAGDAIRYQRFQADGTPIDASTQPFAPTVGASSWYDSHILGMHDDGAFVVVYQKWSAGQVYMAMYDNGANLIADKALGDDGNGFDGWRNVHGRIQPLPGGEYFIPGHGYGSGSWFAHVDSGGTVLYTQPLATKCPHLRVDGGLHLFSPNGTTLQVDVPPYVF